jgi:hypothetical protein
VLSRLECHKLRENGRDRWRACCPAHGGNNPSALSIGVGADDQVLLKCWHGCDVDEVVGALGLELSDLFPPNPANGSGSPPIRRRRLLTAAQGLDLLHDEMHLLIVCASDMVAGKALDESTRNRLLQAGARIAMLRDEAAP